MKTQLYKYKAKIISVYDGDTVTANISLGFNMWMLKQKIRLYGIDTPELRGEERADGLVAKARLEELVMNKEILLESHLDKSGKFGRWLGTLIVEGVNVNQLLVDEGLAEDYLK